MNSAKAKMFDAVQMMRSIRDEIRAEVAAMSVEEENRWLRSRALADDTLCRLMELAAEQGVRAGGTPRQG